MKNLFLAFSVFIVLPIVFFSIYKLIRDLKTLLFRF